ncbi:uncharacterized protein [Halyomorpha halys]|uniref:uncharacterized protein n=1 Tax=Halyomorpha halys TaxID=286706 RepID=UPI0034D27A0A
MEKWNLDIVVLTETKVKGRGQERIGEWIHIWSGVDKDLRVFGYNVSILGIYSPDNNRLVTEKDLFDDILWSNLEKIRHKDQVFIIGDMNALIGKEEKGNPDVGTSGEEKVNNNGLRLRDICEEFDLKVQNTFFQYRKEHLLHLE